MLDRITPPKLIQKVLPKINPLSKLPIITLIIFTIIISFILNRLIVIKAIILASPIRIPKEKDPIYIDSIKFKVIAIALNNVK